MSRYRFDERTGKMLRLNEKTGKWVQDRAKRKGFDFSKRMNFVPDIQEFMAYATDKPQLISSRPQLARYERSNGIRQCGDFKRGEIAERRATKVRREIDAAHKATGVRPGTSVNWTDFR
jgi:hypothetical protein